MSEIISHKSQGQKVLNLLQKNEIASHFKDKRGLLNDHWR